MTNNDAVVEKLMFSKRHMRVCELELNSVNQFLNHPIVLVECAFKYGANQQFKNTLFTGLKQTNFSLSNCVNNTTWGWLTVHFKNNTSTPSVFFVKLFKLF